MIQFIHLYRLIQVGWDSLIKSTDSDELVDADQSVDLGESDESVYETEPNQLNQFNWFSWISWCKSAERFSPNNWLVSIDTQYDKINCF